MVYRNVNFFIVGHGLFPQSCLPLTIPPIGERMRDEKTISGVWYILAQNLLTNWPSHLPSIPPELETCKIACLNFFGVKELKIMYHEPF